MSNERDFKGIWIPKAIWLNDDLSPVEKILLSEIDSLDNDPAKGCFASNEYFGNFLKISEGRAANMISELRKRGYVVQVFFDGRNRGLRLHENVKADFTKDGVSLHKNVKAGFTKRGRLVSRKREHTNTVNNTSNNPIEEKEKKRAQMEEANRLIDEFFDLKTEEPKSPPVAPAPPQVADPIEYATDIAVRYVQANLANYKNWHDIRFVKMPETPQAMRTDIEDFFVYWQRKQPETGGAYQQPEKWFIQNYRTWIGTGKRLKAQHPANAPRSTAQPTSSKQVRRPGGINDF